MKKQFPNLAQGSDKLKSNLDSLLISDATKGKTKTFNPLTDNRKPRVTEKAEQTETAVIEKAKTEVKKSPKSVVLKPVVKVRPEKVVRNPVEVKIPKKEVQPLPEDFRSHSSIYSEGQLQRLRNIVYMKKATVDPKYSIKNALHDAFYMLMDDRQELTDFPDDFFTYSAMVSVKQWERLNSFVYRIKAKEDSKYALKYAIYEAIEMYISANPQ